MRINSINFTQGILNRQNTSISHSKTLNQVTENNLYVQIPLNYNRYLINSSMPKCITFMGHPVHIVDGGNHATNMQHFAKAISNDMDISMHMVETTVKDKNTKNLKSLEQELKKLNEASDLRGVYIAVPALASVAILNIQDQYNKIMGENKKFTPENIKTNKNNLLKFLKEIYENPSLYAKYIKYMDSAEQGIEYTFGAIREINKLISKGAKVYIPSGHPQDQTLKWLANERGLKPELYYYISSGVDANSTIKKLHQEIKDKNWYAFNLLTLSNANIVGVKGTKGAQDYMFAAYDSCITDGARGVYNFTPVRKDGQLIGYSYTDTVSNQYPYEEFPANEEIANIVKFVGKKADELIASSEEIEEMKSKLDKKHNTLSCKNKLYPIEDIFSPKEIVDKKLRLKGEYVDKTLKLFFRKNNDGLIVFPNCNCEGSEKPSVLSMWGSCFAVFNAIARDIRILESAKIKQSLEYSPHKYKETALAYEGAIVDLVDKGISEEKNGNIYNAEKIYNQAIHAFKEYKALGYKKQIYTPYIALGELHFKNKKFDEASACYNIALNMISQILKEKPVAPVTTNKEYSLSMIKEYANRHTALQDYFSEKTWYDSLGFLAQMEITSPSVPDFYYDGKHERNSYLEFYNLYKKTIPLAANIYDKIGQICKLKGEIYPAKVCMAAASDIRNCTSRGDIVLTKRTEGVHYIGDLYSEISES